MSWDIAIWTYDNCCLGRRPIFRTKLSLFFKLIYDISQIGKHKRLSGMLAESIGVSAFEQYLIQLTATSRCENMDDYIDPSPRSKSIAGLAVTRRSCSTWRLPHPDHDFDRWSTWRTRSTCYCPPTSECTYTRHATTHAIFRLFFKTL